jgi:hypothetical protein
MREKIKAFFKELIKEEPEKIEIKICPILNKDCIRNKCQLWVKAHARDFEQYPARCGLEHKKEGWF